MQSADSGASQERNSAASLWYFNFVGWPADEKPAGDERRSRQSGQANREKFWPSRRSPKDDPKHDPTDVDCGKIDSNDADHGIGPIWQASVGDCTTAKRLVRPEELRKV